MLNEPNLLAERFEEQRPRLRAVAYRMLGSSAEADDAVQDAWLRLNRTDAAEIENLDAWLTTVVARVALNMLRARRSRREEPLDSLPNPVVEEPDEGDPEHELLLADSIGLALLVVLDTLTPSERLAFVLHDMFAVPFEQIATILDRSPEATRQLASRARRRVRGTNRVPDVDREAERAVVEAFLAAAREGDFEGLLAVLDPDVLLRVDTGGDELLELRGADAVARQASSFSHVGLVVRRGLVNGVPGWISTRDGQLFSAGAFTVRDGKVVGLDIVADPGRLGELELTLLD
jgi:RNA polymerase sigma factor (sigma-70 family)